MNWRRWASVTAVGLGVVACRENITAPAQCPEFCPPERIDIIDTLIQGVVVGDSAFRGYVDAQTVPIMQFVTEGSAMETRGVTRFAEFEIFIAGGGDTILSLDSFRVAIQMQRRDSTVDSLELELFRLPESVDSTVRFADLDDFFVDSARITMYAIDDSVLSGRLEIVFPASAYPDLGADGSVASIGWRLQSPTETFVDIGTAEAAEWPLIGRYFTIQTGSGDTVHLLIGDSFTEFDTFLAAEPVPHADSVLVVGGLPSARALIRFNLPSFIRDSSDIIKATLLMVMSQPVAAVPNDAGVVRAKAVTRDVGQKSPRGDVAIIVEGSGGVILFGGDFDTIRLDLTDIMVTWTLDSLLPSTIMLNAAPEAGRMFETRFFSSRSALPPALLLSYIPPFQQRRQ